MLTIKQLRQDMQFNRELAELVDVLKGIASAHFRRLQAKREYFLRFNRCLENFFAMVDLVKSKHPFLSLRPSLPTGIVMITSDEGFLGGLNSQVVSAGLSQRKDKDSIVVLGERGAHFLEEGNESFFYFPGIPEDIEYTQPQGLGDYLMQQYLRAKLGRVIIVYPKFISFAVQEVKVEQLLPYTSGPLVEPVEPSLEASPEDLIYKPEILIEPNEGRIVDYLIRLWMGQRIYDIFWESKLSELSSRVIHLEGSSKILSELSKKLQFSYFRTLHQISDKNIREIIASRLMK